MSIVVDASVALAWHFEDEASDAAESIAQRAFREGIAVPAHWTLEMMNGLLKGERSKRTSLAATARFLESLTDMTIALEESDPERVVSVVTPLARIHRLSIYDAAYLELAERGGFPLATFDASLARAARQVGIEVLGVAE